MAVAAGYEPKSYVSDGSLAPRAIEWPIASAAELIVEVDGEPRTLNLHYEVNGVFPAAQIVPLAGFANDGQTVAYRRATQAKQDYNPTGAGLEKTPLVGAIDRTAMVQQEQAEQLGRALAVAVGEVPLPVELPDEGQVLARVGGKLVGVANGAAAFEQAVLVAIAQIAAQIAVALGHAETAGAQAGVAAEQAGISTAQAVAAAGQAAIALAQAGIAATQAGIAQAAAAAPALKVQPNAATPTVPPSGVASGELYWAVNADASLLTLHLNTSGTGAAVLVSGVAITVPTGVSLTAAIVAGEDFQRYQRGFKQSYIALHIGQTADQLRLRSALRFNQRVNALVSPAFICERSERMRKAIVGWGHSAIAGAGSTFSPNADVYENVTSGQTAGLMGRLKARLGEDWRVYNQGIGAQGAEAIAARMGAIPTRITVSGGSIPASGAVNCTLTTGWLENAGGVGYQLPATINGVPVIIKAPVNTGTIPQHTVEQYPGAAGPLAVPANSLIVPSTGDLDYAINIFWIDRNGQDIDKMRYLTGRMAAKVKGERRFIFLNTWNWRNSGGEVIGTTGYDKMAAINAEYRQMWAQDQVDERGLLRGDWPYNGTAHRSGYQLLGLSPSAQDAIDLPLGYIPSTFSSNDGSHHNDAGYDAIAAHLVEDFLPGKGWLYV